MNKFIKILSITSLLFISITPATFAKDNNNDNNISFRSSMNWDYGGGGYSMYRSKQVVMAPWSLPNYYYHQEWIGGKLYKGYLQYSGSIPFGNVLGFLSHLVSATYTGYIYAC
ncbi:MULTISPECIES: hypothetical protein [Gemella]|uniref:hypothetical protein n=1 Tax=Gemella TaxID=1378 RepID=UPI000767DF54|nr:MULTISPECIES: hypothetical protein [Gemella]AME09803.1 hypothetical protein AXE85_06365 [Gemella sp. oral taxon 928]AXI27401.1 hypothetical protein CG018_08290 [Gemella sp. ND 6198]